MDLKHIKSFLCSVEKRKVYKIGEFEIEWIHITHSIIDASALAITTEAGTIIHTGDFKIDHTPIDGFVTDLNRFAHYGEKGVLCLMRIVQTLIKRGLHAQKVRLERHLIAFLPNQQCVIMSTFSSNIHRVYQAIDYGLKYGRKVCVIGRSMERNLFTAIDLGYIKLDKSIFIDPHEVNKHWIRMY